MKKSLNNRLLLSIFWFPFRISKYHIFWRALFGWYYFSSMLQHSRRDFSYIVFKIHEQYIRPLCCESHSDVFRDGRPAASIIFEKTSSLFVCNECEMKSTRLLCRSVTGFMSEIEIHRRALMSITIILINVMEFCEFLFITFLKSVK